MRTLKFNIQSPQHSKRVQIWLLENGYFWGGDYQCPYNLDSKYIYTDVHGEITHGNDDKLFEDHPGLETHIGEYDVPI